MIVGIIGIIIGLGGIFLAWYFYKKTASRDDQKRIAEKIDQIYSAVVTRSGIWVEAQLEKEKPNSNQAPLVTFSSPNGHVKGLVRFKGGQVVYPFDTAVNNRIPIAMANAGSLIEFQTPEVSPDGTILNIDSAGLIDKYEGPDFQGTANLHP